jgi:mannitol/fructose-specific phosphotransferase system IIA component (Ntr-type)
MRLSENFVDNGIIINSKSSSATAIIEELVDAMVKAFDLKHRDEILEAVYAREKDKSTGIGCGLAVPHAKTGYVDRMYTVAATVENGMEYEGAFDGEPVHLLFLIISPANTVGPHMKALSCVSRLMADANVRQELVHAESSENFLQILRRAEDKYL